MSSLNRFAVSFLFLLNLLLIRADSADPLQPGVDYDGSKIAIANLNIEYGARAYGFFSVFDRLKPYVLLRVFNGVQMLSGNGTCYPSFPIMPYAVTESEVHYIEASVQDNYIALVNAANWICLKYLINSEWNNGIAFDLKDECRKGKMEEALLFSLSTSRHVIYMLNHEGTLSVLSLREPDCVFDITEKKPQYARGLVNALHVTNYNSTEDDLVMVSVNSSNQVHVLSIVGEQLHIHNMTAGDKLVAIKTNSRMNIFLAVNRLKDAITSAVVIWYQKGFKYKGKDFFVLPNSLMVDFSATARVTAILTRDLAAGGGHAKNDATPPPNTDFTVVFRPIHEQSNDTEVWYRCLNATDLKGLVLVDSREPPVVKNVCTDKETICKEQHTIACPSSVLQFTILSPLVDPKSVDREAEKKLYLMSSLSVLCLVTMVLLQFIPLA